MIVVNTPNNPGASVLSADDLERFVALTRGTDILIVSDEVYEHMVYDGARHESLARSRRARRAQRRHRLVRQDVPCHRLESGLRVGAARDHAPKSAACINSRCSPSTARCSMRWRSSFAIPHATNHCPPFSPPSATCFRAALADTSLDLLPCRGSYFQLARYDRVSDEPAQEFAQRLVREIGVATIPLSAFYQDGTDHRVIRFCFAKRDETLLAAAERLRRLRS